LEGYQTNSRLALKYVPALVVGWVANHLVIQSAGRIRVFLSPLAVAQRLNLIILRLIIF